MGSTFLVLGGTSFWQLIPQQRVMTLTTALPKYPQRLLELSSMVARATSLTRCNSAVRSHVSEWCRTITASGHSGLTRAGRNRSRRAVRATATHGAFQTQRATSGAAFGVVDQLNESGRWRSKDFSIERSGSLPRGTNRIEKCAAIGTRDAFALSAVS